LRSGGGCAMSDPFNFGSYGASESMPESPDNIKAGHGFGSRGFNESPADGGPFGGTFSDSRNTVTSEAFTGFGEQPGGAIVVGRPPTIWLYFGLAVAAIGAVLAALFSQITIVSLAWILAGPIAIGFLAVFVLQDTRSQSAPIYAVQTYVPWLYRGLLIVAAIGVGLSAWRIAVWVGHL